MGVDGVGVAVVDREAPAAAGRPATAGDLCRPATTLDEDTALTAAWRVVRADPERVAVVVRGRRPVGLVSAERIAEAWPGGGPLVLDAATVADVLPRPVGVATADADADVAGVARRLLRGGTSSIPVVSRRGELLGIVGWPDVVRALLARTAATGSPS